jgi:peptidoglycan/LPS O-acetylase OafA/YrhL
VLNNFRPLFSWNSTILFIKIVPYLYLPYHGKIFYLNYIFNPARWFLPSVSAIMVGASTAIFNFYEHKRVVVFFSSRICLIFAIVLYTCPLYLPYSVFNYLFLFQVLGISLFLAWIFHHQNSLITNLLEMKPVVFIGKISYGIYVWQGLFLKTGPGGKLFIQQFPLNIILVLVVSTLSYYTIEKYALSFRNKFR